MGIDVNIYQARIGLYYLSRKRSESKQKQCKAHYYTHTSGSDIHLRAFATMMIILAIVLMTERLLNAIDFLVSDNPQALYCDQNLGIKSSILNKLHAASITLCLSESAHYFRFRLLILAGDVELNPGSGSLDSGEDRGNESITELLDAFKSFESHSNAAEERLLTK